MSAPLLGLLFLGAAIVVWVASIRLSTSVSLLAERWRLGEALAGLLLLATVEDLPEVVIVVSGALAGHLGLVAGNLLGGIATQTVLLVAIDALGVRDRPLSYRAASLQMVLVGLQGLLLFGLVIVASQLPATLHLWRLDPGSLLLLAAWLGTTWLLNQAQRGLPWRQDDRVALPPTVERAKQMQAAHDRQTSTGRALLVFALAALAILIAGSVLEESGNQLAGKLGMSGIVFGATLLAVATGLPEFVAGYAAAQRGAFVLAVSEVFGSNAFLPVLFVLATMLSGQTALAQAGRADVYLTGLGSVLTTLYLWGLIVRPAQQHLRLGPDSIAVLVTYLLGILGLIALARP